MRATPRGRIRLWARRTEKENETMKYRGSLHVYAENKIAATTITHHHLPPSPRLLLPPLHVSHHKHQRHNHHHTTFSGVTTWGEMRQLPQGAKRQGRHWMQSKLFVKSAVQFRITEYRTPKNSVTFTDILTALLVLTPPLEVDSVKKVDLLVV